MSPLQGGIASLRAEVTGKGYKVQTRKLHGMSVLAGKWSYNRHSLANESPTVRIKTFG